MILNLSIHIFLVQNDRTTRWTLITFLWRCCVPRAIEECTEIVARALKGVLATTQPCSLLHIRQIKSRFVHHDYNHLSELNGWNWVFCRGYLSAIFYQRIELSRELQNNISGLSSALCPPVQVTATAVDRLNLFARTTSEENKKSTNPVSCVQSDNNNFRMPMKLMSMMIIIA